MTLNPGSPSPSAPTPLRAMVYSVVKHDYIARSVAAHSGYRLVGVTDAPSQPNWVHDRNRQFADEFSLEYVPNPAAAVAAWKPDVAVISSQAERHCELAVQAAEAGLHVIVDKPLSTRLVDCDRLVTAVDRCNVRCLVWNRNLLPALLHARQVVERGDIGELKAIHCDFYFAKDAGPPKGSRQTGDPPINWLERQIEAHADGSDGGVGVKPMGELEIEGIYPLAYMHMLTDKRVERVFARTTSHFHQANVDHDVDDLATVTLEMQDGVIGTLCLGRIGVASHPEIGEIKLHLVGTHAGLVVSESRPEVGIYYRGQSQYEYPHVRVADENNFLLLENFRQAVAQGTDTLLTARDGRNICAIVEAAILSSRTGTKTTVRYPPASPD